MNQGGNAQPLETGGRPSLGNFKDRLFEHNRDEC